MYRNGTEREKKKRTAAAHIGMFLSVKIRKKKSQWACRSFIEYCWRYGMKSNKSHGQIIMIRSYHCIFRTRKWRDGMNKRIISKIGQNSTHTYMCMREGKKLSTKLQAEKNPAIYLEVLHKTEAYMRDRGEYFASVCANIFRSDEASICICCIQNKHFSKYSSAVCNWYIKRERKSALKHITTMRMVSAGIDTNLQQTCSTAFERVS